MKDIKRFGIGLVNSNIAGLFRYSAIISVFVVLSASSCSRDAVLFSSISDKEYNTATDQTKVESPLNEEVSRKQKRKTERAILRAKGSYPLPTTDAKNIQD